MSDNMLAYVFWHWRRPEAAASDYEARQRTFHAALANVPAAGYRASFCAGVSDAPWAAAADAYEDWYFVLDFAALGLLNAAVSASRSAPHDAAAALAAGGTAGLYRLKSGVLPTAPTHAYWFGKPEGMSYAELVTALEPNVTRDGAALWMRQMTFGPAREFCLHATQPLILPGSFAPLSLRLRPVWP